MRRKHVKRFSKSISLVFLVVLLSFTMIACNSTKEVEAPVTEVTEEVKEPASVEPVVEPVVVEPVVEEPIVVEPVVVEPAVVEPAVVEPAVVEPAVVEPAVVTEKALPYGVKTIVKDDSGKTEFNLFVIHTNDVHARIEESDSAIGYAKLATLIKMAKMYSDDVLVLDAGDTLHGTNIANFFKGETIAELLDMMGYDAICPGNHDFNYGWKVLKDYADLAEKYSNLRVLCANVLTDDGKLVFQPYQMYDYNGFKVAVIGLTTPDTTVKSHPKNTEGLTFMSDLVVKNAQYAVDMAHEYADFVVVLGHIGMDADGPSGVTSDYICKNVDGIDLFVDGHSHTVLENGATVNGTVIVQTGEYCENIGLVQIHVKDGVATSIYPLLVHASDVKDPANSALGKFAGITSINDDPEVASYIAEKNEELSGVMNQVIANYPQDLQGERADVRVRPTNLSKLICSAMIEETGADVAITNGGGIRASIPAGDVTKGEVNTVLPFGNFVVLTKLTGAQIYEAFEHGYSLLPATNGAFTQSNLNVVYNSKAEAGKRILRLFLNGKAIDKNATYSVATNDFMAAGGDGYSMFSGEFTQFADLDQAVMTYLEKHYPSK